jgi:hypothetical protein
MKSARLLNLASNTLHATAQSLKGLESAFKSQVS